MNFKKLALSCIILSAMTYQLFPLSDEIQLANDNNWIADAPAPKKNVKKSQHKKSTQPVSKKTKTAKTKYSKKKRSARASQQGSSIALDAGEMMGA